MRGEFVNVRLQEGSWVGSLEGKEGNKVGEGKNEGTKVREKKMIV